MKFKIEIKLQSYEFKGKDSELFTNVFFTEKKSFLMKDGLYKAIIQEIKFKKVVYEPKVISEFTINILPITHKKNNIFHLQDNFDELLEKIKKLLNDTNNTLYTYDKSLKIQIKLGV